MRAAVYYKNDDVRVEELLKPKPGPGEFVFNVKASGICGSDVMEWYRIKKAPRVLGHEAVGEIVEVGEGCPYQKGERVFVSHHVPCEECDYCRSGRETACETLHTTNFDPGGFAEYVRVPKINIDKHGVYPLPESMSYEEGTMIEPLACVVRGQRIAGVKKNDTVLVLGSGIAGLLHVKLAKSKGAKVIATDVSDWRLQKAKEFGADTINAMNYTTDELRKINDCKLADKVILCTGAMPAVKQALESVGPGGVIEFFAVPKPGVPVEIPVNDFWRGEVAVMTSYGAAPGDLKESLDLIATKKINVADMITHVLPLEEAQRGFRLVAEAGESIKVILTTPTA
jgi:L-iditol 2-dehydrogenase